MSMSSNPVSDQCSSVPTTSSEVIDQNATKKGFLSHLLDDEDIGATNEFSTKQESSLSFLDITECKLYAAATGDEFADDIEYSDNEDEYGLDDNEDDEEEAIADDLLNDENFYSLYINGEMSFEELMRQMHQTSHTDSANQLDLLAEEEAALETQNDVDIDLQDITPSSSKPVTKYRDSSSKQASSSKSNQFKKGIKRNRRMPEELAKYLAIADIKLSAGDFEGAEKICFDVIKASPKSPDPYQVLSEICCRKDNLEAARNYLFLAAALNPSDIDKWITLIDLAKETNDIGMAIAYARHALRYHRKDMSIREEFVSLLNQHGLVKLAMVTQLATLKIISDSDPAQQFETARILADKFYKMTDYSKAVETYETVFLNWPAYGTDVDRNNAVDLMLQEKLYGRAIKFLVAYCDVKLFYMNGKLVSMKELPQCFQSLAKITKCSFLPSLPPDIIVKLIIVLIHLGQHHLTSEMIESHVYPLDVEVYGDWLFDIGEAFLVKKLYLNCRDILVRLKSSVTFGQARVFLTLGTALNHLEQLEEASEAYQRVLDLQPTSLEARICLSSLQHRLGKSAEAMETLNQPGAEVSEEARRLDYQRCLMLDTREQTDLFVEEAANLLFAPLASFVGQNEAKSLYMNIKTVKHRFAAIKEAMNTRSFNQRFLFPTTSAASGASALPGGVNASALVSGEDLWDLYLRMVSRLFATGQLDRLESSTYFARLLPQFIQDETRSEEADFLLISCAILNRHGQAAYMLVKEWVRKRANNQCWNLFNLSITLSSDLRHNRFVMRELQKDIDSTATSLLHAHTCVIAGSYRYAVAAYSSLYTRYGDNPLIQLMLGITFLNLATQKYITNRHTLVVQLMAFLNEYRKNRGRCQEVYYNMGRALHQITLCHAAIGYYEKVLALEPIGKTDRERQLTDLTKEAAFNLMLMYKKGGNKRMAHYILQKYLVIS